MQDISEGKGPWIIGCVTFSKLVPGSIHKVLLHLLQGSIFIVLGDSPLFTTAVLLIIDYTIRIDFTLTKHMFTLSKHYLA